MAQQSPAEVKRQIAIDRCDMTKIKHKRWREYTDPRGRARKVLQVHLQPSPERVRAHTAYTCPAGPGKRPVPSEGRWYDLTDYLRKRLRQGDVVACAPAAAKAEPPKSEATTPKPKKDDKR